MPPLVDWMTNADRVILDWFDGADSVAAAPPTTVYISLSGDRPSYQHVAERMRKLRRAGLLEKHPDADSHYRISEKGRRFLADELTADDLPDPDA